MSIAQADFENIDIGTAIPKEATNIHQRARPLSISMTAPRLYPLVLAECATFGKYCQTASDASVTATTWPLRSRCNRSGSLSSRCRCGALRVRRKKVLTQCPGIPYSLVRSYSSVIPTSAASRICFAFVGVAEERH